MSIRKIDFFLFLHLDKTIFFIYNNTYIKYINL